MTTTLAFLQNIGAFELIIILIVALLLFGRKLPEVARNIGKGITQFKRGVQDAKDTINTEIDMAAEEEIQKRQEEDKTKQAAPPTAQPTHPTHPGTSHLQADVSQN